MCWFQQARPCPAQPALPFQGMIRWGVQAARVHVGQQKADASRRICSLLRLLLGQARPRATCLGCVLSTRGVLTTATSCRMSAASEILPSASFMAASLRVNLARSISTNICHRKAQQEHSGGDVRVVPLYNGLPVMLKDLAPPGLPLSVTVPWWCAWWWEVSCLHAHQETGCHTMHAQEGKCRTLQVGG